jgi:hypothetical protein
MCQDYSNSAAPHLESTRWRNAACSHAPPGMPSAHRLPLHSLPLCKAHEEPHAFTLKQYSPTHMLGDVQEATHPSSSIQACVIPKPDDHVRAPQACAALAHCAFKLTLYLICSTSLQQPPAQEGRQQQRQQPHISRQLTGSHRRTLSARKQFQHAGRSSHCTSWKACSGCRLFMWLAQRLTLLAVGLAALLLL